MLRAKFLITLAVIGGIHQFYSDNDTDMAKMQVPAASCSSHSGTVQAANTTDMDAIGAQSRNCADAVVRINGFNG